MAQSSHHLANERREGQRGQSCPPPPQLSQAGASPRFGRGETVSRKGQTRGLSRVTGNGHARFLGGRAAVTPLLLPGKATYMAKALRDRVGKRYKGTQGTRKLSTMDG